MLTPGLPCIACLTHRMPILYTSCSASTHKQQQSTPVTNRAADKLCKTPAPCSMNAHAMRRLCKPPACGDYLQPVGGCLQLGQQL